VKRAIYLVRHTTPDVVYGTCYGFTDLDVAPTFDEEVQRLKGIMPSGAVSLHSSPLQRCYKLAQALYDTPIQTDARLKEVNFGAWEMVPWTQIPETGPNTWMQDYLYDPLPEGESYAQLYARSIAAFRNIVKTAAPDKPIVVVAHGGVIRSILAFVSGTPLEEPHTQRITYGQAACILENNNQLQIEGICL
jgi:alpha-ribazole phosphatase